MYKLLKQADRKTIVLGVLALIFVALQGLFEGLQATMLAQVLSTVKQDPTVPGFWAQYWYSASMLLVNAILSLGFGALGSWVGTKSSLLLAQTLRHNMFLKTTSLSFADIDKVTTSSILTRITNDIQKFQVAFQMILTMLVRAPIMFFFGIVRSFMHHWMFGLLFVGIMSLIIIGFVIVAKTVVPAFERVQFEIDNANIVIRENVLGMKVIKSFCLEKQQSDRFAIYNERLRKQNTKAWVGFGIVLPLVNSIINASMASIFLIGGQMVISHSSTITSASDTYELVNLLMMTLTSVIIACMVIITYVRAKPSIKRVNEIYGLEPSIKNHPNPVKLDPKHLDIEFKNVNFKYFEDAQHYVLKKFNLKIKQGETLGIIGTTGSGKTSIINLLSRLYDLPDGHGSITIGGNPIKKIDLNSLQDQIGVVLQERILFSGTIKSNLLYGNQKATDEQLMHAAKIACADEIINEKKGKLSAAVEQRGRNFSGGQQQRLCITRTLVKKPNILILDDSTSALDMLTEAKLQANIKREMKGITTIIVAQRISSVKDCDNIVVMEHGEMVGYGNHDTLRKNNEIYRSIVVSQMGQAGLR